MADAVRLVVSYFPGRTRALTLLPDKDLLLQDGHFVSSGHDPRFLVADPRRLPGGWGVVGDDLVAGAYTCVLLHLGVYYLSGPLGL